MERIFSENVCTSNSHENNEEDEAVNVSLAQAEEAEEEDILPVITDSKAEDMDLRVIPNTVYVSKT